MLLDIFLFALAFFCTFPFSMWLYDWYIDFFKGKTMVEITHKDGRIERQFLSSKETHEFLKTARRYGTVRKAERVKR